jgi:hypothetical protein
VKTQMDPFYHPRWRNQAQSRTGQRAQKSARGNDLKTKTTSPTLSDYCQAKIASPADTVNKSSLLSLPCRSWSPNYSVLVFAGKPRFHRNRIFGSIVPF